MSQNRVVSFAVYVFAALAFVFLALPAAAQDNSSLTGVVTDPSGGVVAGATVTLTNPAIGFSATATTNDVGAYEFTKIPPAPDYSIVISKTGFSTMTLNKITLLVGAKETEDAQLSVGDSKISVEVTSKPAETLNTTDAAIGSSIDGDRIQDLPSILVNNAANYLYLSPGATQTGEVAGTRSDQTNITLDGLDVNDQRGGFAFVTTVNDPLDSIQELTVTTSGNDATYGHSAGGQVQLVTKSGTNNFHGQAFEYNRVTAYAANDYFNKLFGIPNPQLIRNQFGGDLGGPIIKNKLFFFFSYNGLRQVAPDQINNVVPLPSFYNGQLAYVNSSGSTVLSPTTGPNSVTQLDPAKIGPNTDLINFLQARGYAGTATMPAPNNSAVGDGLNTAGYFFVEPIRNVDNTYIGRIDFQATANHRLFARATFDRSMDGAFGGINIVAWPGDPNPSSTFIDHSRAWVVGDTWTLNPNMTNQASFGETTQVNAFAIPFKPVFPNELSFFNGTLGNIFTNPYLGLNEQFPTVPVYQARDTFTWTKGNHQIQFGGLISPVVFKSGNLTDTNTDQVGIGGLLSALTPSQRPSDFSPSGNTSEWDGLFALMLGRYASVSSGYNYDLAGNPLPQGGVPIRDYHSTQYEFFAQDSWRLNPSITLTYGLRWGFHNPLSEIHGFEVVQNQTPYSIFSVRQSNAQQGVSGPFATPLITYSPGGSANNAPGYYKPSYSNFAPRIGLAYSPGYTDGFLGKLFGNRRTSIRAGFALNYDNNLIGQGFELDETSFLFSNTPVENFGNLATDPRFVCPAPCNAAALAANLPAPVPGGTSPRPSFTPNLDANGVPIGFFNGGFGEGSFFNFDPNYSTPYEMNFSLGFQRELPSDWLLEIDYVGKLGRRLPAIGDVAQTVNFKDAASGQTLYNAFGTVQKEIQTGSPLTNQPWFENQMTAALAQSGNTCATASTIIQGVTPTNSCTNLAAQLAGFFFFDGDVSSLIQNLANNHQVTGTLEQALLLPNVGLPAQTGAMGYIGNFSSSNYNALQIRLNHRISHNLTMELNYTYSHSIDNDSDVQNNLISYLSQGAAEVCDLRNLRVCRGSSDFDHRHLLSSNFIYDLPFGKGQRFGSESSKLVDELIGGWHFSGIATAYSGAPFKIDSGAFTIDFTQSQPAVFIGTKADISGGVHQVSNGPGVPPTVQYFSNPTNALGAFTFPIAGGPGNRNVVTGPDFWNVDLAMLKDFKMPWSESHILQFRVDAINAFNHVNFSPPVSASLQFPGTFGSITSDVNGPRNVQLALRYIF